MRRFDWRRFEERSLFDRYDEHLRNASVWRNFVEQLVAGRFGPEFGPLELFDQFLEDIPAVTVRNPIPCVFISHQRADTARGIRVACLADRQGLDTWLDVHDPALNLANTLPDTDPRKSILIAAIIEIALLSCTHVIALHTDNSLKSRWVPYELGRAKARKIRSSQAAGWFERDPNLSSYSDYVKKHSDYVQLAVMVQMESEVEDWLRRIKGPPRSPPEVADECDGTISLDDPLP